MRNIINDNNNYVAAYCRRVYDFFTKKLVLAGVSVEKSPVHFYVPNIRIQRTEYRRRYPQVKEYV